MRIKRFSKRKHAKAPKNVVHKHVRVGVHQWRNMVLSIISVYKKYGMSGNGQDIEFMKQKRKKTRVDGAEMSVKNVSETAISRYGSSNSI